MPTYMVVNGQAVPVNAWVVKNGVPISLDDAPAGQTYADAVLADSPSLYVQCEETSGTTLADSSGGGRTGTLVGNPVLSVDGRIGSGIQMDGSGDAVSFGSVLTGSASFAFELWVKPTANLPYIGGLFGVGTATAPLQRILIDSDRSLRFDVCNANDITALNFLTSPALPLNVWTHVVALVENGSSATPTRRIFYDGVEVASATGGEALAPLSGQIWAGQRDGNTQVYAGYMDELAVYGNGLTAAQVSAHYNAAGA